MKILLVHNAYQERGGEDVAFEQERQLLEQAGHQVVTYRRSNHEADRLVGLGRLALVKQVVWAQDARRDMARLLSRERPRIVHVHNTFFMTSPSIFWACQDAGVPVVQTLHNYRLLCPAATFFREGRVCEECPEHSLWRGIRYACYRDSRPATAAIALMLTVHRRLGTWAKTLDYYIALSEFARRKFIAGGLPADKVMVKPNYVRRDPGPRSGDGEFALFVGRLSREKGLESLIGAWGRLSPQIPLTIVGDGPLRAWVEAEAGRKSISTISLTGYLGREQTLAAMKAARFLIVPSVCFENFPVAIAEAFSCGTPVICSQLGAMQEIVEDGHTGLHFEPGNPEDLASKVHWAWFHPQEMRALGREARAEYEAKYTDKRNYELLINIYQRAMEAHG